jgi:mRNA interferase HigB
MQIVAKKRLKEFWKKHPQAQTPLETWHALVAKAAWKRPSDVKRNFGATADFLGDSRVVFDIAGNKYRLIVHISYEYKALLIKFIGTHAEYDKIDAETVT